MPWVTPKTDWYGYIDGNGNYQGDRFNAEDYNRIKNNLNELRDMASKVYGYFNIQDMGADKNVGDYFYADEINTMEDNLETINTNSLNLDIGTSPTFEANGLAMTFNDLNRLESMSLEIYESLSIRLDGLRKFTWNFGFKGGDFNA